MKAGDDFEKGMIEAIQERLAASEANGPKYQVLYTAIVGAISDGDWKPSTRLPTEAELAQSLPYSLGTIQKAYGELVKNGLVVRARGRGSFVAPMRPQMAEPWYCRFLDENGSLLPVYPRLPRYRAILRDARLSQLFGKAKVIRIDRANSINDEFEVITRFYCSRAIARHLIGLPREKMQTANFKLIVLREFGVPITRFVQTIAVADPKAWRKLGIHSRPNVVLEATAYTADGTVAFFQEIYVPANRRKLVFDSELKF